MACVGAQVERGLPTGKDREYAERVLDSGGMLDVSPVIEIDDKMQIISGLLRLCRRLDLQGFTMTKTAYTSDVIWNKLRIPMLKSEKCAKGALTTARTA